MAPRIDRGGNVFMGVRRLRAALTAAVSVSVVCGLAFSTTPALAGAPEAPEVEGVHFVAATASSDTLEAQLNPEEQGVSCKVQFVSEAVFKASGFTDGVSATGCAPVPPANEFGDGGSPVAFTALLEGLEEGVTYEYRIVASNGAGTLETAPALLSRSAPVVLETTPGPEVSAVGQHTAVVTPTFDPEVQAPIGTSYYVIFGSERASGNASVHQSAASGLVAESAAPVTLTGLQADTTYRYAVLVSNGNAATVGPEHQFTTLPSEAPNAPPAIGAQSTRYVNENGAVIEGEINPEGQASTYQVQYGTSTGYGLTAPAAPAELSAFTSSHGVFTDLGGLSPGTTYHYRILASNASGTSYGPDETFATTGATQTSTFTPFAVPSVPRLAIAPYTFPAQTAGSAPGTSKVVVRKHKQSTPASACKKASKKTTRAKCRKNAHKQRSRKHTNSDGKRG
jgi:hypothetical protein